MRLFVAIPITGEPSIRLRQTLAEFGRLAPAARWEAPEALHLTLKFIGSWPDEKLDTLLAALEPLPRPAIELRLRGLGAFPAPQRPRVVWAGVEPNPALEREAAEIEQRLAPLGIARESRPFRPHVSLARPRSPRDLGPVRERLAGTAPDFGVCRSAGFTLYQTVPGAPPRTRYRPVRVFGDG